MRVQVPAKFAALISLGIVLGLSGALGQSPAAPEADTRKGGIYDDGTRPAQRPGPKAGVWDDTTKPGPKGNPKGGVYDDGVKPVQRPNPKSGVRDATTKPDPNAGR